MCVDQEAAAAFKLGTTVFRFCNCQSIEQERLYVKRDTLNNVNTISKTVDKWLILGYTCI